MITNLIKKRKYPALSWWENYMGGHFSMNLPFNILMTIYGENAMRWSVNILTKKYGYICFTLPTYKRITKTKDWYFYISPDGTPCSSTYYIGYDKNEHIRAKIRKFNLGTNWDLTEENYLINRTINDKFWSFKISEFDIEKFKKNNL